MADRRNKQRTKIGVYGEKTRQFQKNLSYQLFQLTFKTANVYRYLGSRASDVPNIDDIQNKVFYEVPDRAYSTDTVSIHIGMEPLSESAMDFSRFGMINPMSGEQTFRVHQNDFACLGRNLIVGDVLEVPFLERDCNKAFFEITDVDDKPSYEKFYYTIQATPLGDSRTTREIPVERSNDDLMSGFMDEATAEAEEQVPHEGLDPTQTDDWDGTLPEHDVDYRRKKQASFLDDPNIDFTNED